MKRTISLILTALMIFTLCQPAFCEETFVADKEMVYLKNLASEYYDSFDVPKVDSWFNGIHYKVTTGMEVIPKIVDGAIDGSYLSVSHPANAGTVFYTPSTVSPSDSGLYVLECDFMIEEDAMYQQGFSAKGFYKNDEGKNTTKWIGYTVKADGSIVCMGSANVVCPAGTISAKTWYKFKMVFDVVNQETSFYLNGEYKSTFPFGTPKPVYGIDYVEMSPTAGHTFAIDNLKVDVAAYKYTYSAKPVDADGTELPDGIDYRAPRIALSFTESVSERNTWTEDIENPENIEEVFPKILLETGGEIVKADYVFSEDKKTIYIEPEGQLVPSTDYIVKLDKTFKSAQGLELGEDVTLEFKTCKPAFSISDVSVSEISESRELLTDVTISNKDGIDANALLVVASRDAEGHLISIASSNVLGTVHGKNYPLTVLSPNTLEGASVKVFLLNSFETQILIDKFEVSLQ